MAIGDLATWVGAIATAAAGGFAGWQLLLLRRQQVEAVHAERDGVAVTWVQKKPRAVRADGSALWHFGITVHNPGRLPIRNVRVEMTFPRDVRRLYSEDHIDDPTRVLDLGLPVLAGSSVHTWKRALLMTFDETQSLRTITARVVFTDLKGKDWTNEWGSGTQAN